MARPSRGGQRQHGGRALGGRQGLQRPSKGVVPRLEAEAEMRMSLGIRR